MRILIAEDDPVSRRILQMSLLKLGHECVVATNGLEAWELFQSSDCEVIISDWMMPGLTGIELCERVRANPQESYTFFILLTALTEKQHFASGMEAGADDYLMKPLDREDLRLRLITAERVTSLHKQLAAQTRELANLNRRLFEEGRTDPLTRLRNRLCLREDIEVLEDHVKRYGHFYAIGMCDIDYYKKYNDTYGHQAGDDVLATVGKTLKQVSRDGDMVYRYGGEEFLVVLPEQTIASASVAMNRMRNAVSALLIEHSQSPHQKITISVGIAGVVSGAYKKFDDILADADQALYHAKEAGRNTVVVCEEGQGFRVAGSSTGAPA